LTFPMHFSMTFLTFFLLSYFSGLSKPNNRLRFSLERR